MKRRFFETVVTHRAIVVVLFVFLAAVCAWSRQFVGVDYDMNDYLPVDTASTRAIDAMSEQFDGGIPNVRVMVRDVSVKEAAEYERRLEAVEGVEDVTWVDDYVSTTVPYELLPNSIVETFYKDGNALFNVTVDGTKRIEAITGMRDVIGEENAMAGSAVNTAAGTLSTVSEIRVISVLSIAFAALVLVLMTTSWLEPLVLLAGLGVAVLVNGGTNLMFGTVSFVTNAAGTILQLGISLDFAVFMLHRYEENRGLHATPDEDMVQALCQASTAILSSALTVMFGFLALTVMQFRIGPDLGFALAKGIAVSLVTVFTFVPALLLVCRRPIEATRHRRIIPEPKRFASFVAKTAVPIACVFMLVPIPAFLASTSDDASYWYGASHIFNADSQVGRDRAAIEDTFGTRDTYALLVPRSEVSAQRALSKDLHEIEQVVSVLSYVDIFGPMTSENAVPGAIMDKLASSEYARMVVTVEAEYEGEATFGLVERIRALTSEHFGDGYLLAGEGVSTTDLMTTITEDKGLVDLLAVAAVFVVLALALRSVLLPAVLVIAIESAIWINFAIPVVTGSDTFYIAYLIESAIQLGATVDYAILLTDRYTQLRREMDKRAAMRKTVQTVTLPVLISGTVLTVCGFAMGAVSSHGVLAQLGMFLGRGVLLSLAVVLLVVPGLLCLLDTPIRKTTRGGREWTVRHDL